MKKPQNTFANRGFTAHEQQCFGLSGSDSNSEENALADR